MYIEIDSLAGRKALAECPFLPFALAEAARFCKKYPGRFDLGELQSIAAEALITSKGFKHSRKAIAGALADFARDGDKLVRDVEMTEEEFARTRGGPPSNARLMAGPGKASSKHGKVRLALGRSSFKDGWNQKLDTKWVRAKGVDGDADDSEAVDPRGGEIAIGPAAPGAKSRFPIRTESPRSSSTLTSCRLYPTSASARATSASLRPHHPRRRGFSGAPIFANGCAAAYGGAGSPAFPTTISTTITSASRSSPRTTAASARGAASLT
jgi:hypothetical protein